MLRVGLTGGLGSGKSTVAAMLAAYGAHVFSADDIGRELMAKGQPVFRAILDHFGPDVLREDGALDRTALARVAFTQGRAEELNAIVHPAVIARQAELTAEFAVLHPRTVFVVESALLFETKHAGVGGWQARFDRIVLVRAREDQKIARFAQRSFGNLKVSPDLAAEAHAEAQRRLGLQRDDDWKAAHSDYVLTNNGSLAELQHQVDTLWPALELLARN